MTYKDLKIIKDKLDKCPYSPHLAPIMDLTVPDYRTWAIPALIDDNSDYLKWLEKEIHHYFIKALIYLKLPLTFLNIENYKSGVKRSHWHGEYNTNNKIITININKYEDEFIHYSKKGTLQDLKDFLRKTYKVWHKRKQKEIARLIGEPYIVRYKIPELARYL